MKTQELKDAFIYETTEHLTAAGLENSSAKLLPKNTVLMAMYGATVGKLAILGKDMSCNQASCALVVNEEKAHHRFLFYLLLNDREKIRDLANGAAQQNLSAAVIRNLKYLFPPLSEQRAIAEMLGALDDKIDSNLRTMRLQWDLAFAEFRRFDSAPTLPFGEGFSPGISGVWGEEESAGANDVPTLCLRGKDIEAFINGTKLEAPIRYVTSAQMGKRAWVEGELWTAGSGTLGPTMMMTESLRRSERLPLSNSNFVKRFIPNGKLLSELALMTILRAQQTGDFSQYRTGSAIPNLDTDGLMLGLLVPDVTAQEAKRLCELVHAASAPDLRNQNASLAKLRDALLPELLSGRIRVGEDAA